MILTIDTYRLEVDVETTRKYYLDYEAKGLATALQRNQHEYFERVLGEGVKDFLRMLGIVNHLPIILDDALRKGTRLRFGRAAYPLFGRLSLRKRRGMPFWRIGEDGSITGTQFLDVKNNAILILRPEESFQAHCRKKLPPDFSAPLLLSVINGFGEWVLDEPCPVPEEDEAYRQEEAKRRAELSSALETALKQEGLRPRMLDAIETEAVYGEWFQSFAKARVVREMRDPAVEQPPRPPRLHLMFRDARPIGVQEIFNVYGSLPARDCYLMLGGGDVCARLTDGRLPTLRLVDRFIKYDVYLADAKSGYCLSGQPDRVNPPYKLAKGEAL